MSADVCRCLQASARDENPGDSKHPARSTWSCTRLKTRKAGTPRRSLRLKLLRFALEESKSEGGMIPSEWPMELNSCSAAASSLSSCLSWTCVAHCWTALMPLTSLDVLGHLNSCSRAWSLSFWPISWGREDTWESRRYSSLQPLFPSKVLLYRRESPPAKVHRDLRVVVDDNCFLG